MIKLQNFCALVILLGLMSCDDKAAKPATSMQSFPQFDSFQAPSEIEQLEAKLSETPRDFEALSALGTLYFESSRYIEAIQTIDRAITVNPLCANCLNDKGLALFYTGNPVAALESFDQAVAIDPGYIHAWLSKGFVLVSQGRYQDAIDPLNKVKELDTTGLLTAEADKFLALAAEKSLK